jgi:hypothetical protein
VKKFLQNIIPLPRREGMKERGISNLKKFFNSSPSPYPLSSRERGNYLIFSHLPSDKGGLGGFPGNSSIRNIASLVAAWPG